MKRIIFFITCLFVVSTFAQDALYDESKIPDFTLPDPLTTTNGEKIESVKDWETVQRPEILKQFTENVYGKAPEFNIPIAYKILEQSDNALDGKAKRKQIRIFLDKDKSQFLDLLIYLPINAKGPVAGFVGCNFAGNHSIQSDPAILITESWMRNNEKLGITDHRAKEKQRGTSASRWPVEKIIDRGFMVATWYYGDVDPDVDDFSNGIHPLNYKQGQTHPAPNEWGSIAAWAWGLSRAMDYFEKDNDIDQNKIILIGHSRLGKTALWAGATDQRFAIVISNESGCGGAALSRREYGETVKRINTVFPHWFCDNFKKYNDNVNSLPIDQHMLIALIAPRPVYVASAVGDQWADPKGEFLSAKYASPVYQLYGLEGMTAEEHPDLEEPVQSIIAYHIRSGEHDLTVYDWQQYLDFSERYLQQ